METILESFRGASFAARNRSRCPANAVGFALSDE